jgi:hypothetical protein
VHRVNTAWHIPSCVDSNDHPILVEDIELRLDANAGEYPAHGSLLDRRRLDRGRSPLHVKAHQFLTYAAHPVRMLVIAEASRLLLLLPCPPEQFHYGFGLEIFLALELVAEVGDERRANGPIERHAGRGRIWNREQVLVNHRISQSEKTRTWPGARTAAMPMARVATLERRANKSIMLLWRRGGNEAGHAELLPRRTPPPVANVLKTTQQRNGQTKKDEWTGRQ